MPITEPMFIKTKASKLSRIRHIVIFDCYCVRQWATAKRHPMRRVLWPKQNAAFVSKHAHFHVWCHRIAVVIHREMHWVMWPRGRIMWTRPIPSSVILSSPKFPISARWNWICRMTMVAMAVYRMRHTQQANDL